MMNIRFKPVEDEEGLFYHIKDIKLNFTSQQKFFKNQAIYVCERLNKLNNEVDFYQNQLLELRKLTGDNDNKK